MIEAAGWVVAIIAVELVARRYIRSRARAWLVAYGILLLVALGSGAGLSTGSNAPQMLWLGIVLALVGYSAGRMVLRSRPDHPPRDPWWMDALTLGLLIPVVEELTWGARVEPELGIWMTAALFAVKHVIIDRGWRRLLGLALFWIGLGIIRSDHPEVALVLHVIVNLAGVTLGHLTRKDQF